MLNGLFIFIGTSESIQDAHATEMANQFYAALGGGKSTPCRGGLQTF